MNHELAALDNAGFKLLCSIFKSEVTVGRESYMTREQVQNFFLVPGSRTTSLPEKLSIFSIATTFSNWCTRKMPLVSRPCEPTSWRKQVDSPAYLIGKSSGFSHSSLCRAAIGCSEVAMRYFSSMVVSSLFSLPLPRT